MGEAQTFLVVSGKNVDAQAKQVVTVSNVVQLGIDAVKTQAVAGVIREYEVAQVAHTVREV